MCKENEDTWSCPYCGKHLNDRYHLRQHEQTCLHNESREQEYLDLSKALDGERESLHELEEE